MRLISMVAAAAAAIGFSGGAALADYPEKPIKVVVSFAAGGNADILARLQAEEMSQALGVPVTVVNKPGGAHIPATMSVKEAPADGYTILNWAPPNFMVVPLTRKVPYSVQNDFVPIHALATASNALYVRNDSPIETFEQFVEAAKAEKLAIGVNNLGAPPNLSAVQLASEFGLEFKTIALKTVPATMTGLVGGQVDVAVGQLASFANFKDQVRPLVILDNARLPYFEERLPGIPTVGEVFPGKQAGVWVRGGWAVKAGTPDEIIETLRNATSGFGTDEFTASVPPGIDVDYVVGDPVSALIQDGIDLYSPILDGLGLLQK